jgi:hypothetical protein
MLERLFGAIVNGPSLNCRPHHSRQRFDLAGLSSLRDLDPAGVLRAVLGDGARASLSARAPAPPVSARARWREAGAEGDEPGAPETPEQAAARRAWADQQGLLSKVRTLVDEARTYEDDTGVWALDLGFPLLSLPPGTVAGRSGGTRRVLAPVALIPVSITVRTGPGAGLTIACRCEDVDRVKPNEALLSWIEQQTGTARGEVFSDEEGTSPWKEIATLVRMVAGATGAETPACFASDEMPAEIPLIAAPRAEETGERPRVVMSAVVGLYPMANQGLLRDTREMMEQGVDPGPVESFLRADATLTPAAAPEADPAAMKAVGRPMKEERLIAGADPCQARAVALARTSGGLVIHGPPGTGKSQTITNIIGDHLARGERVLFVCEKRTALDVVATRLEHLGLGELCAVIHDPQRDQHDLYRSIREQLESLADTHSDPKAAAEVQKIDEELERVLGELREVHRGLMTERGGPTLHALIGEWLSLATDGGDHEGIPGATLAELDRATPELREILQRAAEAGYAQSPWAAAAALTVEELVSRPMDRFRAGMDGWAGAAAEADAGEHESIPPFAPDRPLEEQGAARERLAGLLDRALAADERVRALWAGRDAGAVERGRRVLKEVSPAFEAMRAGGDAELWAVVRQAPPGAAEIARRLGALGSYLRASKARWGFLALGAKRQAGGVLKGLGLELSPESAERAKGFYSWLRAVNAVADAAGQLEGGAAPAPDAEALGAAMRSHSAVLAALVAAAEPALVGIRSAVVQAVQAGPGDPAASRLRDGLARSNARAAALAALERAAAAAGLAGDAWLSERAKEWRAGAPAVELAQSLRRTLPMLEEVLRVREGLARQPGALRPALRRLVESATGAGEGLRSLRRGVLEAEVTRRLDAEPQLRALDGRRLATLFSRYSELEARKRERVRDAIRHRWVSRQRERLLAGTGSRLNSEGAEVKRRLAIRGRRAMRLRQVLALGRTAEGGDPLMDLRPVWMASPETVAQVFPRARVFVVVVFDEASQCRLEEALPVLTRAARMVIAGDPKQLPPTRFFESAVAGSDAEEPATDQDLFEAQQAEVEDLLGAALGLDVHQSYLDVHYRSRNSDLIAFSNGAFYGSRLQPIPGHPRHRARFAPVTLYPVGGTYDKRVNTVEAERVCGIIRDLLKRAEPPSIGVGCFNIAQRDLIVETLEEMAANDAAFAAALGAARERRGAGSAESLFVKNLENVQGDERDHIIISTTYGPDPQGRFYRRFGPLAMPGGGRRLNVLVTRARLEVHVVTSIPPEAYRALPPVPQGQQPGGGWLLFSYLKFAEDLGAEYEREREAIDAERARAGGEPAPPAPPAHALVRPTGAPSAVAGAVGERLAARHGWPCVVHWGNDGFCVDVALRHPTRPEDVTVGALCDLTRYPLAADPVEWDLFRTAVLESQGWELTRLWSPVLFRDCRGSLERVVARAKAVARETDDPDAIRVKR